MHFFSKIVITILILTSLFFLPTFSVASGVVERKEKMKQQTLEQQRTGRSHNFPGDSYEPRPKPYKSRFYTQEDLFEEEEEVGEVIDLAQVWRELEVSSEIWPLIMDDEPKEMTIEKYKEWYAQKGIRIKKPADYYRKIIDDLAYQSPNMLKQPFKDILMFAAVTEYDYDNGGDRDALARKFLGEKLYRENRKRLGLE